MLTRRAALDGGCFDCQLALFDQGRFGGIGDGCFVRNGG